MWWTATWYLTQVQWGEGRGWYLLFKNITKLILTQNEKSSNYKCKPIENCSISRDSANKYPSETRTTLQSQLSRANLIETVVIPQYFWFLKMDFTHSCIYVMNATNFEDVSKLKNWTRKSAKFTMNAISVEVCLVYCCWWVCNNENLQRIVVMLPWRMVSPERKNYSRHMIERSFLIQVNTAEDNFAQLEKVSYDILKRTNKFCSPTSVSEMV